MSISVQQFSSRRMFPSSRTPDRIYTCLYKSWSYNRTPDDTLEDLDASLLHRLPASEETQAGRSGYALFCSRCCRCAQVVATARGVFSLDSGSFGDETCSPMWNARSAGLVVSEAEHFGHGSVLLQTL